MKGWFYIDSINPRIPVQGTLAFSRYAFFLFSSAQVKIKFYAKRLGIIHLVSNSTLNVPSSRTFSSL